MNLFELSEKLNDFRRKYPELSEKFHKLLVMPFEPFGKFLECFVNFLKCSLNFLNSCLVYLLYFLGWPLNALGSSTNFRKVAKFIRVLLKFSGEFTKRYESFLNVIEVLWISCKFPEISGKLKKKPKSFLE